MSISAHEGHAKCIRKAREAIRKARETGDKWWLGSARQWLHIAGIWRKKRTAIAAATGEK